MPVISNLTCLTSQNVVNMRNINRPWPKSIQYWSWSGYMSMPNFRIVLTCVIQKMPRNPIYDQFNKSKILPKCGISTNHDNIQISSDSGQDTFACHILNHYFHALLQKCLDTSNFSCSTNILACGTWKFHRWLWKISKLFHPRSWMLQSNLMKFEWKLQEILPQEECQMDRQMDGQMRWMSVLTKHNFYG